MNEILGGTLLPGVVRFNYLEAPAGKTKQLWHKPPPSKPERTKLSPLGALDK